MRLVAYMGVVVALALASTSTFAFQEQGAAPPAGTPAAQAAPAEGAKAPEADFSTPKTEAQSGTEVRIPGLGRLGVLPKMDFGLELLYGANETKPADAEQRPQSEDLMIHGSVKHNF